jgi:hypothetical protein
VLTQALYDEAPGLVNDLANVGGQELHDKMFQTWEDSALDERIDETASGIWFSITAVSQRVGYFELRLQTIRTRTWSKLYFVGRNPR